MQPTYMTTAELCAYLAGRYPRPVKKRTIENWRHLDRRGPPFVKQGANVFYVLKEVQKWEAMGGMLRQGGVQ